MASPGIASLLTLFFFSISPMQGQITPLLTDVTTDSTPTPNQTTTQLPFTNGVTTILANVTTESTSTTNQTTTQPPFTNEVVTTLLANVTNSTPTTNQTATHHSPFTNEVVTTLLANVTTDSTPTTNQTATHPPFTNEVVTTLLANVTNDSTPTTNQTATHPPFTNEDDVGIFVDRPPVEHQSHNGWYNNLGRLDFGGTETSLMRTLPSAYSDGSYSMAGADRPNPLLISEKLAKGEAGKTSYNKKSLLMVFFGKHLVHEIMDTHRSSCPPEYEHLQIPASRRESFPGAPDMPFMRSAPDETTDPHVNNVRQQLNLATTWIDGSSIYGSSHTWASAIRDHYGGRLAHSDKSRHFPQMNKEGLPMVNYPASNDTELRDSRYLMKLGNYRGHETPYLSAVGVLMFRWHNYWADEFKKRTDWDDERIFNEAHKWVVATYQKIAFYDWLPAFLDPDEEEKEMIQSYKGYKAYVNPGISHEFQAAAMRFGHTLVPPAVYSRNKTCEYNEIGNIEGARMCNVYWNPGDLIEQTGVEDILLGMASQRAEREDHIIVEDLRSFSYGPHAFSRTDLVAIDILRGRDHGLPDYNTVRKAYGLDVKETFFDINPDFEDIEALIEIMDIHGNSTRQLDLWTGGMIETTKRGPGELFRKIILDQFSRIRDGDRFWFENTENGLFTEKQIAYIHNLTIYDVITLSIPDISRSDIQTNPFFFQEGDPCFDEGKLEEMSRVAKDDDLQECTPLKNFDYFEGTWISVAITAGIIVAWIVGVMLVVFILAKRQSRRSKRARQVTLRRRSIRRKSSLGIIGERIVADEWCGPGETRTVEVCYRKTPRALLVYSTEIRKKKVLRTIDLGGQRITVLLSLDNDRRTVLLKVEKEYDLALFFDDEDDRNAFIESFEEFLADTNVMTGTVKIKDKELMKMVVTKDKRQQNLERFVRAAFAHAFEPDKDMDDSLDEFERRQILATEMTKNEFADILSLTKESTFVDRMFELADKDKSGTISFREFLDVTVIFTEGQADDKLKMIFNMYDIDNSGMLSRQDLEAMLKSLLEMARASMEEQQVQEAISAMFSNAGLENKNALTLDDFKELMAEHMEDLGNASLEVQGRDSRHSSKDHLSIEIIKKQYPRSAWKRRLNAYLTYTENHMSHIFWLCLYCLVLAGVVGYKFYVYTFESEHKGMREVTGLGLAITRAAAAAQSFLFATLLVTVCRNLITKLRETAFSNYIPIDSSLEFHKIVAYMALIFSVIHTAGHFSNFMHLTAQPADDVTCLVRAAFHRSNELPKFHHWVWTTVTGMSGVLLVMVISVMYTFATKYARRRVFKLFWTAHQLYVLFYVLCIVHGSARLVQNPDFYKYLLAPLILFIIDKLISTSRKAIEIPVLDAQILPSEVTGLVFTRPKTFEYKSGQWVRIACLPLGAREYHPFTLTSAPHEDNLSVHVRAVGPWTTALRKVYDPANLGDNPLPKIFLDGPYGEGHQDWFKFEVSVLVGAGIGVTPFASILKDIVYNADRRTQLHCKKVYFIWITRTQKHFEWFTDIIGKVEDNDKNDFVSTHIFITQFFQEYDLRTTMLYVCERHFYKVSNKSLFTGLKSETHFGRPDFVQFLNTLAEKHSNVAPIGVFSCGPPQMNTGLVTACNQLNKVHGTVRFSHHGETF